MKMWNTSILVLFLMGCRDSSIVKTEQNKMDSHIEFAINLLPELKENQLHIIRAGSIQYSYSYNIITILYQDNHVIKVRYSQINAPDIIERFPEKFKADYPTLKSYFFKLHADQGLIQNLKFNTPKYTIRQLDSLNQHFASSVKSEGITGNQFYIIWPSGSKIGLVNKFSDLELRKDVFNVFSQISINEHIQLISLDCNAMNSIDSARWYLNNKDSLNLVRKYALDDNWGCVSK